MITRRQFIKTSVVAAGAFGAFALSACSSGSSSGSSATSATSSQKAETYNLGDTVTTDIIDFTLSNAMLAFYADGRLAWDSQTKVVTAKSVETYALPEESPNGDRDFTANKGRALVCLQFVVKNNDRGEIDIGGSFASWLNDDFTIAYNGKDYLVKAYDLNDPDGDSFGFSLSDAITSLSAGEKWVHSGSSNYLLKAGQELTVRTVGIASFEPSNLADAFQFKVDILSSSKGEKQFIYTVG